MDSGRLSIIKAAAESLGFYADDDDPVTSDWWVFFPNSHDASLVFNGVQFYVVGCYDRISVCQYATSDEDSAWERAAPYLGAAMMKMCRGDDALSAKLAGAVFDMLNVEED